MFRGCCVQVCSLRSVLHSHRMQRLAPWYTVLHTRSTTPMCTHHINIPHPTPPNTSNSSTAPCTTPLNAAPSLCPAGRERPHLPVPARPREADQVSPGPTCTGCSGLGGLWCHGSPAGAGRGQGRGAWGAGRSGIMAGGPLGGRWWWWWGGGRAGGVVWHLGRVRRARWADGGWLLYWEL